LLVVHDLGHVDAVPGHRLPAVAVAVLAPVIAAALTATQQLYGETSGIDSFLRDQQTCRRVSTS
jgi:hypothetical protein